MTKRAAVLLFWVGACGSYKKDMATICALPGAPTPGVTAAEKLTLAVSQTSAQLSSREGRDFLNSLDKLPPSLRVAALRHEARAQGVGPCAFAEFIAREHKEDAE